MRHPVVIPHRYQYATRPRVNGPCPRADFRTDVQIELLEPLLGLAPRLRVHAARNRKYDEQQERETYSRDCRDLLREKVRHCYKEENERGQEQSNRDFTIADD